MKKFIVAVLVICMVAMMGMAAFAADAVITKFDAADIDAFMNYNTGLAGYGIAAPNLSKTGAGVKIECGDGASVQSFYLKDEAVLNAVKNVNSSKYVRVYVESGSAAVSLRIAFNDSDGGAVAFDCSKAVLIGTDGSKPAVATADGGGYGTDSAVTIPANFKGYVVLSVEALTIAPPSGWNRPAYDASKLESVELDIRNGQGSSYVLGEMVATDSAEAPSEGPAATADVTTIAFAAAAVLSCGALTVVRKKK
ncbi:MAG: hypothetical protein KH354_01925 [Clostridiales bacterium]|nr:hypothetical protein [Clostridiales bacterium]